ncbi:helix-turn-helix domain-containing protein [Anaerotignum sp.]
MIPLDYYKIGQRIRKFRKALGLSQDQLAEAVNISTPHMSHIETGNTKLSLPVLVSIAQALNVSTDELLSDTPASRKNDALQQIQSVLDSCSPKQTIIIAEIIKSAKAAMDKYKE